MNITIAQTELNKALTIIQSIVEKKTTMPILANVLLSASEGKLHLSATNLELTAIVSVKAETPATGSTTVNAKVFSEIIRELPDTDVNLKLSEGERLEIGAGSSHFKMIGVSAEEFPSLPGISVPVKSKIKAEQFSEMISKTIYAVSHDETRFNLNGVYFEPAKNNSLRMVSTDGHRLAMITRPTEGLKFSDSVIVPTKGLSEIRRVIDSLGSSEVGVEIAEGFFVVETDATKVSMRLIDGEFPDYNQVLPKKKGERVNISSEELTRALKRASLMVTDKGKCVKFEFNDNNLKISSSSPELGESSEELEVDYKGEPLTVGFNAKYLIDFTTSLEEGQPLVIELNGELGPGKLSAKDDDSYVGVVMPMRLT